METKYSKGQHPNTLANIGGSEPYYEEAKKKRSLWVTDFAWTALDRMAKARNLSRAELIEQIGREIVRIEDSTDAA